MGKDGRGTRNRPEVERRVEVVVDFESPLVPVRVPRLITVVPVVTTSRPTAPPPDVPMQVVVELGRVDGGAGRQRRRREPRRRKGEALRLPTPVLAREAIGPWFPPRLNTAAPDARQGRRPRWTVCTIYTAPRGVNPRSCFSLCWSHALTAMQQRHFSPASFILQVATCSRL